MRVDRCSGSVLSTRSSTAPSCEARYSAPSFSRSANEMIQSPSDSPSKVTTLTTESIASRPSRNIVLCASSSVKTTLLPESVMMNSVSSTVEVG